MVTKDLLHFGSEEKKTAGELLSVLGTENDKTHFLGDDVQLFLNDESGCVFLSDSDYNTAMLDDDGDLRDWHNCPVCGSEGFLEDLHDGEPASDEECQEWFDDLLESIAND
jgi:hypothetical protein